MYVTYSTDRSFTIRSEIAMSDASASNLDPDTLISYLHEHDVPLTDRLKALEYLPASRPPVLPLTHRYDPQETFYGEHL